MSQPTDAEPLSAPLYDATPQQALARVFRKYATFSGRASRSEYWWWFLAAAAVNLVLRVADVLSSGGWQASVRTAASLGDLLGYLWALVILVPTLAVTVRRLHDSGHSGLWVLIVAVPVVGAFILLALLAAPDSTAGDRFD